MNILVQSISLNGLKAPVVAYVDLLIDGWLAIHGAKLCNSNGRVFVAMPNKIGGDGEWHDSVYPINRMGREAIHKAVVDAYVSLYGSDRLAAPVLPHPDL